MSDDELRRYAGIGSQSRRRQFVAGHWLLRLMVARIHQDDPEQWLLETGVDGAPRLQCRSKPNEAAVCASLSHCGDRLAASIAPFPIGVDLEFPAKHRDVLALADTVFSVDEREQLRTLPEAERADAFYLFWTIKESVGKRSGRGLHRTRARQQIPSACTPSDADVQTWQFDGFSLSLAGAADMHVQATCVPTSAIRRFWRIGAA